MRSWHHELLAACAVVLGVGFPCFGQTSPGPATLENLVNSPEAQGTPAVPEATPKRPAGTVVRPQDGVQHPDLDKAWAEYDAVVTKAAEGIKAAITKQFDASTAKGDLDAAEKWQAAMEKFEKAGEVPAETEVKAAVSVAVADYKKAKEALDKAYEAVVKALTVEKNIADAKAARDEARMITASTEPPGKAVGVAGEAVGKEPQGDIVFLCDLQERDALVGFGNLGKGDALGYEGRLVQVQGVRHKKSVSTHPPSNGLAKVTFDIPKGLTHFEAKAAINDGANNHTPLRFKLYADKKLLWTSRPLHGAGSKDDCSVALKGAKTITLIVECPGYNGSAMAVWLDPTFTNK
jgi:hypothetical protein